MVTREYYVVAFRPFALRVALPTTKQHVTKSEIRHLRAKVQASAEVLAQRVEEVRKGKPALRDRGPRRLVRSDCEIARNLTAFHETH